MPQMGFNPPDGTRKGQIHYDGPCSDRGVRCEVGRCPHPCRHCNAKQCEGRVTWTMMQIEQGVVVYCSAPERHAYKLNISG